MPVTVFVVSTRSICHGGELWDRTVVQLWSVIIRIPAEFLPRGFKLTNYETRASFSDDEVISLHLASQIPLW